MPNTSKIEKIRLTDKFTWVNISSPNEKSVAHLKRNYKFHPLDLEDCLSEIQRPKIDDYKDYLFIVLHIPAKSNRRTRIKNSEVKIFIGPKYVITLHNNDPSIKKIFENCKKKKKIKEEYMSKGPGYFLYMIIDDLFESNFPLLDNLSKTLTEMEKDVFESDYTKDILKDILLLKKDIINFRRIIMPQRTIIAQLEHKNKKFLPEKLDVYFDDTVDKVEKIWNNLENLQELVASLQETNESIISHNTNNVIRTLTVFSVIMLPLTFITGFYGMNVSRLPYAESSYSVWFILAILVLIVLGMISYFKYRKWL